MNRTLRLGYVDLMPPFLNECGVHQKQWLTCDRPGISAEIWRVLYSRLNYTSVEFVKTDSYSSPDPISKTQWTSGGLMDLLIKGKVDASYTYAMFVNEERLGHVQFSAPISSYHFGFVAGDLIADQQTSLKVEVFQRLALLLLVLLTLLFGLVNGLINNNLRDGLWRALSTACMQFKDDPKAIRNGLIILGYAMLFLNYSAGFRSQTLNKTIIQSSMFAMDRIRQNLGLGKVSLIVSGSSVLGPIARRLLFGDENVNLDDYGAIDEGDFTLAAALLCSSQNLLFFGNIEMLHLGNDHSNCRLRTLSIPFESGVFLDLTGPLAIALSPKFSRKERKIIDDVLLRIFTPELIANYWMPKYGIREHQHGDDELGNGRSLFESISTDHIWGVIVLAIIGFSLAITVFATEYFHVLNCLKLAAVRSRRWENNEENWILSNSV